MVAFGRKSRHPSNSLNSFKQLHRGLNRAPILGLIKGDARSLDYGSDVGL